MAKFEDGCYGSLKGISLIAKVLAGRCPMHYTRVAAGKGTIPDDLTPKTLEEPPEYVMDAIISAVTNPVDGECQVSVQINSANVEAGFYVTWLVLYAQDPDEGEVPFTVLCLENEPEWIRPSSSIVGKLAHFDIIAAVGDVDRVTATIDPDALLTYKDLKELLDGIGTDRIDITVPASGWVPDTDTAGAYALHVDVADTKITEQMIPVLNILPQSLGTAIACKLCPAAQTFNGRLRLYAQTMPSTELSASLTVLDTTYLDDGKISGSVVQVKEDIAIPTSGWKTDAETGCLCLDIAWPEAMREMTPMLTILPAYLATANACGFSQFCQAVDKSVRLYAKSAPTSVIHANLALLGPSHYMINSNTAPAYSGVLPAATGQRLGAVRVKEGSGLTVDNDGNLSLDTASSEQVQAMFKTEI